MFEYNTTTELKSMTQLHSMKISEIAVMHEAERDETDVIAIKEKMALSLTVMKSNIKTGVANCSPSLGGLIGANAKAMHEYQANAITLGGEIQSKAISYALAITEENARMKRIVACPTAGACGVVPGCLVATCEVRNLDDDVLTSALFCASAIGIIIAHGATISGAVGGCQAEVGAASAMAACALVELLGGSVDECINAAAIALKNVLGLVCDPVGGLVEVPCSKRNAMGVANAIAAADMARAGITSVIPLDEVILAMKQIGQQLPFELKETSKGGIAVSKTAKEINKNIVKQTAKMFDNK
jgi:L-serine dehydratase